MKKTLKFDELNVNTQKMMNEFRKLANYFVPRNHVLKDVTVTFEEKKQK